jgi:hypothetical protein
MMMVGIVESRSNDLDGTLTSPSAADDALPVGVTFE